MSIEITGLKELLKDLDRLPEIRKRVILDLSQIAFDSAYEGAGRHVETGALQQSLYNRSIANGGRAVGHDTRRAPHALFVLFGTKPHTIVPKDKQSLRFPLGGKFKFAARVDHPGYIGDNYLFKAADDAADKIQSVFDRAIREYT